MSKKHSPITKFMGDTPSNDQELELLRRRAWKEQGVLMISPFDPKLTDHERKVLCSIAENRYGGAK